MKCIIIESCMIGLYGKDTLQQAQGDMLVDTFTDMGDTLIKIGFQTKDKEEKVCHHSFTITIFYKASMV